MSGSSGTSVGFGPMNFPGSLAAIPVETARRIVTAHGYDRLIILAMRVDGRGAPLDWLVTYGTDAGHAASAYDIGTRIRDQFGRVVASTGQARVLRTPEERVARGRFL